MPSPLIMAVKSRSENANEPVAGRDYPERPFMVNVNEVPILKNKKPGDEVSFTVTGKVFDISLNGDITIDLGKFNAGINEQKKKDETPMVRTQTQLLPGGTA